jgi:hypothetical protein
MWISEMACSVTERGIRQSLSVVRNQQVYGPRGSMALEIKKSDTGKMCSVGKIPTIARQRDPSTLHRSSNPPHHHMHTSTVHCTEIRNNKTTAQSQGCREAC